MNRGGNDEENDKLSVIRSFFVIEGGNGSGALSWFCISK